MLIEPFRLVSSIQSLRLMFLVIIDSSFFTFASRHRIDVAVDSFRNFHFSLTPSRPAVKSQPLLNMGSQMDPRYAIQYELIYHEILEYGLAVNGLRADHAIYTGASYPGTKRLYEFTVGLHTAVRALACFITPAMK